MLKNGRASISAKCVSNTMEVMKRDQRMPQLVMQLGMACSCTRQVFLFQTGSSCTCQVLSKPHFTRAAGAVEARTQCPPEFAVPALRKWFVQQLLPCDQPTYRDRLALFFNTLNVLSLFYDGLLCVFLTQRCFSQSGATRPYQNAQQAALQTFQPDWEQPRVSSRYTAYHYAYQDRKGGGGAVRDDMSLLIFNPLTLNFSCAPFM